MERSARRKAKTLRLVNFTSLRASEPQSTGSEASLGGKLTALAVSS
jgi:hypothetical protein